jgi:hypothetical protein
VLDPELDPELVLDPELEPEPELVLDPELVLAPLLLPDEDPELLPELPEDEPVPAVLLLHPANPPNARVARNVAETRAMGRRGLMGTDPSNGCARPDVTRDILDRAWTTGRLERLTGAGRGRRGPHDAIRGSMTCGCRQARHTDENARPLSATHAARRWWIDLSAGRSVARVELPRLVAVRVGGVDVVRLDELWAASHLGVSPVSLTFDFVADDGFQIASKQPATCASAPGTSCGNRCPSGHASGV